MSFCAFYIFYLFVVDKGVSLAPTYSSIVVRKSDLCSSSRTKRCLSCWALTRSMQFSISHIFREGNGCMDRLANYGVTLKVQSGEAPSLVLSENPLV